MLLKAPSIDRLDSPVHAIDRDLIWSQPHNLTILLMRHVGSSISSLFVSLPQDPEGRVRGRRVGIGNPGKRRNKAWEKDKSIEDV